MTDMFSGIFNNTVNSIHNRQAAQALAGNDYAGAMSNLARVGNLQGVNNLRTQQRSEQAAEQAAQQEQSARSVAFARQATRAIGKTMQDGGDPLATFDQIAPAMQSLGATPEQINGYRQQLAQNPRGFLQGISSLLDNEERKLQIVNFGSGLGAAVVDERTGQEVSRINPTYRPVGDVLYDPSKGEVVFDARKPEYQTIRNADGSTSVVAIDPNPLAGSGGGSKGAPAAGNSVGERNNNEGNIRDVGQFAGNPAYLGKDERGFARFSNAEAGNQAQERQLNLYYTGRSRHTPSGPVQNIGGIIDIYAPVGSENSAESVANYKSYVARRLGIGVNDRVPEDKIPALAQAMREFETGNTVGSGASQPAPAAQGGARVVAAGAPETRGSEYALLTPEEKRSQGLPETGTYQRNTRTGQITAVAGGDSARNDRKSEADLRKEFNARAEVKDFNTIRSAYQNVRSAGANPSAAGDLSMIFAYMKLLDPGSVVREQEFANAQNAAGVPDQVRNMYNRALNGQRLNPNQRGDFISQAERLYQSRRQTYDQIVGEYRGYAQDYGLNPDRIVSGEQDAPEQRRPRLSFQPSQQQLGWVRQNSPSSSAPVGSAQNPRLINPQSATQSFNNIRSGQYFVAPDGQLRRKP